MSPRTRALSSAIEFTHPTGVIPATATTTPSARVRRCPSTARRVRLLDEPRRRRHAIPRPTVRSSLRTPHRVCAAVRKPTLGVPPSGFTYGPYRGHTNLSVSEQRKIIRRFVYRRGHFKGI